MPSNALDRPAVLTIAPLEEQRRDRGESRPGVSDASSTLHPAMRVLLSAFESLDRRGVGPAAWAPAFSENPISFLLDTVADAIALRRGDGGLVYRNRASARLGDVLRDPVAFEHFDYDGRAYERRCVIYETGAGALFVEIISERR